MTSAFYYEQVLQHIQYEFDRNGLNAQHAASLRASQSRVALADRGRDLVAKLRGRPTGRRREALA